VQEVPVDRAGQRPAISGHGGHHQQPHALEGLADLFGRQPTLAGDDVAQVRPGPRSTAVKEILQPNGFLRRFKHGSIVAPVRQSSRGG
jgi:hypothetical protein